MNSSWRVFLRSVSCARLCLGMKKQFFHQVVQSEGGRKNYSCGLKPRIAECMRIAQTTRALTITDKCNRKDHIETER